MSGKGEPKSKLAASKPATKLSNKSTGKGTTSKSTGTKSKPTTTTKKKGTKNTSSKAIDEAIAKLSIQTEEPLELCLEEAGRVILENSDVELKKALKWPLFIDESKKLATLCMDKPSQAQYINCTDINNLKHDTVRTKALSALFKGLPLIIDLGSETELALARFENACTEFDANFYNDVCSKSALDNNPDRYKDLIRDSDGNSFEGASEEVKNFKLVFLSSESGVEEFASKFAIPITITDSEA